jgi:putative transposase
MSLKVVIKHGSHTPAHMFVDETAYFITGATYHKRPLLAQADIKTAVLELIQKYFAQYRWTLEHWVLLNNHYHLLGRSMRGADLTAIFQAIHSCAAIEIRQRTQCPKPIWWNFWDYCPRDDAGDFTRLNYLLNNPVKHGYVSDLHQYPFSSFHTILGLLGRDQLVKQFRDYPDYKTLILTEAQNDDF